MSEEQVQPATEEESQPPVEETPQEKVDIGTELQELGRQLTAATKAVLASPEAQELKTQLQRGLDSLEQSVNKVAAQARETEVGQKVESSVSEVKTTVKERRMVETVAESMANVLRAVNQSLGQAVEKAETRAQEGKKSVPQQIEIREAEEEEPGESAAGQE